MDWLCPNYSRPLGEMLTAAHGTLTPATLYSHVFGNLQSGDLHITVMDLTDGTMWVSFYAPTSSPVQWPRKAYDRAYTAFQLDDLFNHALPRIADSAQLSVEA